MFRYSFNQFVIFVLLGSVIFFTLAEAVQIHFVVVLICIVLIYILNYIIQRFFALERLIWSIKVLFGVFLGFCLAWFSYSIQPKVSENFLNKQVQVIGKIVSLPITSMSMYGKNKLQFVFEVQQVKSETEKHYSYFSPKVKLSWYEGNKEFLPNLAIGQVWCLPVKLKANHASMNPSGFDYEQYLLTQNIAGSGYIRNKYSQAFLLEEGGFDLQSWLSKRINSLFKNSEYLDLYRALLIGDKSLIDADRWQVLQRTGTIHLMAISGLHIGIMAMVGIVLFGLIWQMMIRFSITIRRIPKQLFSAYGTLILITLYLVISGMAVSTQRAWIMAVVLIGLLFLRRKFQPWSALSLAAILVVIWQPFSVLSVGFWLSFIAVALIFLALQTPIIKSFKNWQKLIAIQLVLTVGMLPILAFYFQQVPLISSIANLIAVPFVSVLALPLLFFSFVFSLIFDTFYTPLGTFWVEITNFVWQVLWQVLLWLAEIKQTVWLIGKVTIWQVLAVYLVWLGLYFSKWNVIISLLLGLLSFLLIIVVVANLRVEKPEALGSFQLTVLDVGQGEAIVIETKNHVMIYDTGAKWGDKLDGAKLAILPYLKQQRIKTVDVLLVSHGDSDHSGGVNSLLKAVQVKQTVTGDVPKLNSITASKRFTDCHQRQWLFDEVAFSVISQAVNTKDSNDKSCVLQITTGQSSVLIMGDVSKKIEQQLVNRYGDNLQSEILIAGHHGSNTSTSKKFLETVNPNMTVISAGYKNSFGFPNHNVISRIENSPSSWLNTACSGAIGFTITQQGWRVDYQERIRRQKQFHNRCVAK